MTDEVKLSTNNINEFLQEPAEEFANFCFKSPSKDKSIDNSDINPIL